MHGLFNNMAFTIIGALVALGMTLLYIQRSLAPDAGMHQYVVTGIWALMATAWITALIIRLRRARHGKSRS